MRPNSKLQSPFNTKLILISASVLLFVFLIITRTSTFSKQNPSTNSESHIGSTKTEPDPIEPKQVDCPSLPLTPTCTKAPPSLANALIHYAATNITPQQTFKEISVSARVLEKKSPCNFLVFGLGHDSLMWTSLNHGGRTVFLEEDKAWIEQVSQKIPGLESHHVEYVTKVHQADRLLNTGTKEECKVVGDPRFSKCELALKGFPDEIYDVEWDLIMVDAPTGFHDEAPGRMNAIYTAGLMARNREEGETDVFVHDVDRVVEDKFSMSFLCEGYLKEQQGRLRHFNIPSHRARSGKPSGITMLQRIGTGIALSIIAMVVAALVEIKRLKTAREHGLIDEPNATVPMRVWWLVPQYLLFGLSGVFAIVGLQEFFYDQMPIELRSLGIAVYLSVLGVGNFLSSFLISVIEKVTGGDGRDSWFADNLNRAHLDYFYWLLAALSAIGLVLYVYCTKSYIYVRGTKL